MCLCLVVAFFFLWQKSSRYALQKTSFFDTTRIKKHTKHTNKSVITFFSLSSHLWCLNYCCFFVPSISSFRFVSSFRCFGKKNLEEEKSNVLLMSHFCVGPSKRRLKNMMSSCAPRTVVVVVVVVVCRYSSFAIENLLLLLLLLLCAFFARMVVVVVVSRGKKGTRVVLFDATKASRVSGATPPLEILMTTTTTTTTTTTLRIDIIIIIIIIIATMGKRTWWWVDGVEARDFVAMRARVVDSENVDGDG